MTLHHPSSARRRPQMFRRSLCAALLAPLAWPALAGAAETPHDRYDMDVICEARGQTGLPIPNQTPDKTAILARMYAKRVQASGAAAGKTSTQIAKDVAYWRGRLLQEARSPQKPAGQSDPLEVGKLGEYCSALPFFEAVKRLKGGS